MKKIFAVMVATVMMVAVLATTVHAETAVVTAPDIQFTGGETSGTDSYGMKDMSPPTVMCTGHCKDCWGEEVENDET